MKIAVASKGKDKKSKVSEVAGRAPYYLIFDGKELKKVIKNPFRVGGGGAGFGVAEMLADEGVNLVISGRFGNNMIGAMESRGMKYKEVEGISVEKALNEE